MEEVIREVTVVMVVVPDHVTVKDLMVVLIVIMVSLTDYGRVTVDSFLSLKNSEDSRKGYLVRCVMDEMAGDAAQTAVPLRNQRVLGRKELLQERRGIAPTIGSEKKHKDLQNILIWLVDVVGLYVLNYGYVDAFLKV